MSFMAVSHKWVPDAISGMEVYVSFNLSCSSHNGKMETISKLESTVARHVQSPFTAG